MELGSFQFFYVAAITFLTVFLLHSFLTRKRPRRRLPPGLALALPFLGHLPFLKQPLHATLGRLAARHGPVFSLRLGSRPAIVVASAEVSRECFSSELDATLANRPRFPSLQEVSFDYRALTLASYGAHWRAARRLAVVHLLSARRVDLMSDAVVARELRVLVRRLARVAAGGAARVELKRRLFDLSHSVLMEAIAEPEHILRRRSGHVPGGAGDEGHRGRHRAARRCRQPVGLSAGAALARLARRQTAAGRRSEPEERLYLQAHRRGEAEAVERISGAGGKPLSFKKKKQLNAAAAADKQEEEQSMIGVMLSLQRSEPDMYTDTFIAALVANLLGAGTETTSTTTEWAMALLLNHPAVLKKGQKEIDMHLSLLDKKDLPYLPYLHCIISETLRLCPAAAATRGRRRLQAPRLRRRRGHDRARQRVHHPPRPGGVGVGTRAGGVQAGEVRAWQRRGEAHDTIRDGKAQVPRGEPRHEDHGHGSWHADPVLRLGKGRG